MEWAVKMIKDSSDIPPLRGQAVRNEMVRDRKCTEAVCVSTADPTRLYCRLPLTQGVYIRTNNGRTSTWKVVVMFRGLQTQFRCH